MEIDRPSPRGACVAVMDLRIMFQIVNLPYQGRDTEWIEGSATLSPHDERLYHDPPEMTPAMIRTRNQVIMEGLFTSRLHAIRMTRPTVPPDLQQGADLGTMQAMIAGMAKAFDLSRR